MDVALYLWRWRISSMIRAHDHNSLERYSGRESYNSPDIAKLNNSLLILFLKKIVELVFITLQFIWNLLLHLIQVENPQSNIRDINSYNDIAIDKHIGEFGQSTGFFDRFYAFIDSEIGLLPTDIDQYSTHVLFEDYFSNGSVKKIDNIINQIGIDAAYKRLKIYHFYYPHLRMASANAILYIGKEVPLKVKKY